MNLTKKRKILIYSEVLRLLKEDLGDYLNYGVSAALGFCGHIKNAQKLLGLPIINDPYDGIERYSEIYQHKPPRHEWAGGHWFERNIKGMRIRIKIVETELKKLAK